MVNKTIIKKWVKALRSNKYKQGRNRLRHCDNEFCCLGVLCDVVDNTLWHKYNYYENLGLHQWQYNHCAINLPTTLRGKIGLSWKDEETLVTLNDNRHYTFKSIAQTGWKESFCVQSKLP